MYEPVIVVEFFEYKNTPFTTEYFHHISNARAFFLETFENDWNDNNLDESFYDEDKDFYIHEFEETDRIGNYGMIYYRVFCD